MPGKQVVYRRIQRPRYTNVASARTLERLRFRAEGLLRERWIVGGEACDSALYGLLRRDWLARDEGRSIDRA